jgi:hypothetical protein
VRRLPALPLCFFAAANKSKCACSQFCVTRVPSKYSLASSISASVLPLWTLFHKSAGSSAIPLVFPATGAAAIKPPFALMMGCGALCGAAVPCRLESAKLLAIGRGGALSFGVLLLLPIQRYRAKVSAITGARIGIGFLSMRLRATRTRCRAVRSMPWSIADESLPAGQGPLESWSGDTAVPQIGQNPRVLA